MLGGTPIFIRFCQNISESETIQCRFGDVESQGFKMDSSLVLCVSPLLQKSGLTPLEVKFGSQVNVKANFLSCKCLVIVLYFNESIPVVLAIEKLITKLTH